MKDNQSAYDNRFRCAHLCIASTLGQTEILNAMEILEEFWKGALAVAGIAAVVSFVFWSLYKKWLNLPIFSTLPSIQQYKLLRLFLVLTFLFALAGLMSFVATNKSNGKMKHPAISFKKLDHKEELIASFKPRIPKNRLQERRGIVIEQGELISLRFTSKNLDLDFYFDAPYEMKVSHLHNQLINHFSMYEHVIIDYSQFIRVS